MLGKMGEGVKIAEEHREKKRHEGFVADLFRGRASFNNIFPWRGRTDADWAKEKQVLADLTRLLLQKIDPEYVERTRNIPPQFFADLARGGFFSLKVPEEEGGRGLSQTAYSHTIALTNSFSTAIGILLSADNTIGAKFPVMKYGTPEQKARYMPELMKTPSAFCFTEKDVGSDPARMSTYALRARDTSGKFKCYILCGGKQYITNAALLEDGKLLAKYLAVVAKIVDNKTEVAESECFGMFIIPSSAVGVEMGPINEFCGMHGIYNSNPKFNYVLVEPDQLIGQEGQGFKIALEALNTGRISIAAGCLGLAKQAFTASRWWAKKRHQWGKPIGEHEEIGSGYLVPDSVRTLVIEAMVNYASGLVDRKEDVRLTAAVCKVFASEEGWQTADNMMQIFGGRGYETFASISRREKTAPVERIWRDFRPNRTFEGSSQILPQWIMREGKQDFLQEFAKLLEEEDLLKEATKLLLKDIEWFLKEANDSLEKSSPWKKFKVYSRLGWQFLKLFWPNRIPYVELPYPYLKSHLFFVERESRRFKRTLMLLAYIHKVGLVQKQLVMKRCFWIAAHLLAIPVVLSYAQHVSPRYSLEVFELADMFAREAKLTIEELHRKIWKNNDHQAGLIASKIMEGHYQFLHEGIIPCVNLKEVY